MFKIRGATQVCVEEDQESLLEQKGPLSSEQLERVQAGYESCSCSSLFLPPHPPSRPCGNAAQNRALITVSVRLSCASTCLSSQSPLYRTPHTILSDSRGNSLEIDMFAGRQEPVIRVLRESGQVSNIFSVFNVAEKEMLVCGRQQCVQGLPPTVFVQTQCSQLTLVWN